MARQRSSRPRAHPEMLAAISHCGHAQGIRSGSNCGEPLNQLAEKRYGDGGAKFLTVPLSLNAGLSGAEGGASGESQAGVGTLGESPCPSGLADIDGWGHLLSRSTGSEGWRKSPTLAPGVRGISSGLPNISGSGRNVGREKSSPALKRPEVAADGSTGWPPESAPISLAVAGSR